MADSRARIWFSLFVLVVFCLGMATGMLIDRRVQRPFGPRAHGPGLRGNPFVLEGPPGRGGAMASRLIDRLSSELQLDAAQSAQLRTIVSERRERLEQVHRDARDRFDKEQRELHQAIRGILRPDQQAKFDRFVEHRR
jgi:hypothetical protein